MKKIQLAVMAAALAGAVSASATLVYNTGVGTSGSADLNWLITATTTAATLPTLPFNPIITDNSVPGSWLPNSADSKWISPLYANGLSPDNGNSIGYYTYEQKFFVDASLAGATLSGRWSSDNHGWSGINLNGGGWVDGNMDLYAFETWHPFTAGTLVAGWNTIDFQLWDGYSPPGGNNGPGVYTGLRVEFNAVPEPTTMIAGALLLLPFGASTLRLLRKKRMAGLIGVGALALGLLASGGSAKANLIVNGSFELGAFVDNTGQDTMDLAPGSTAMTGWTVTTANLAWIGPSNPFGLSASDGSYFLDLSGYHDNQPYGGVAASTAISTVIGQQYNVAFDLGSDSTYNTASPGVEVALNGNPPTGTFTATSFAAHNLWETFNFAFIATSVNTVVTFQGVGTDNQKYIGLDNVVVSAVPEPTTMIAGALLLLPFGASTLRLLRKNRKA